MTMNCIGLEICGRPLRQALNPLQVIDLQGIFYAYRQNGLPNLALSHTRCRKSQRKTRAAAQRAGNL
jgi:hypothetical protein